MCKCYIISKIIQPWFVNNSLIGYLKLGKEICKVSDEIKNSIRQADILIRWGGEEFLLLLRITESYKLETILNNIRSNIQSKNITNVGNITCSIGALFINPMIRY